MYRKSFLATDEHGFSRTIEEALTQSVFHLCPSVAFFAPETEFRYMLSDPGGRVARTGVSDPGYSASFCLPSVPASRDSPRCGVQRTQSRWERTESGKDCAESGKDCAE